MKKAALSKASIAFENAAFGIRFDFTRPMDSDLLKPRVLPGRPQVPSRSACSKRPEPHFQAYPMS